jgi:hypothetical protein
VPDPTGTPQAVQNLESAGILAPQFVQNAVVPAGAGGAWASGLPQSVQNLPSSGFWSPQAEHWIMVIPPLDSCSLWLYFASLLETACRIV